LEHVGRDGKKGVGITFIARRDEAKFTFLQDVHRMEIPALQDVAKLQTLLIESMNLSLVPVDPLSKAVVPDTSSEDNEEVSTADASTSTTDISEPY